MSGHMMRTTMPTPGTNELTRRLLAQGVRLDDHRTWPENVWACQQNAFAFSREWRFCPTWESPCGLLIHDWGDFWGDTWIEGEFKCAENFNPLFECPRPGTPCPHRKRLPKGINCQFHETSREWTEEASAEKLYKLRAAEDRALWESDIQRCPGWAGVCPNIRNQELPDGSFKRTYRYDVANCISFGCTSTQCICRLGAERDLTKVNIFYDLYTEREIVEGFTRYTDRSLLKGLRVFEKPIARTDAEIAYRIWQHDPDSPIMPRRLADKLNASDNMDHKEAFFIAHHGQYNGRVIERITTEVRDIRIARHEQRDMLADLQAVQDGIAVQHDSDLKKAAEAAKTARRRDAKVKKAAKQLADAKRPNSMASMLLRQQKQEFQDAVRAEAERIRMNREQEERKKEQAGQQLSLFREG